MEINLEIKESSLNHVNSDSKVAFKNLEEYDKGNYKVSEQRKQELLKRIEKVMKTEIKILLS